MARTKKVEIKETKIVDEQVLTTKADLEKEYVSAVFGNITNTLRSLPRSFDDLTRDLGLEVYENMCQDDEVAANIDFLISACTAQDGLVMPTIDQGDDNYDKALEIANFVQRCVNGMATPIITVNEYLLRGLSHGSSLCEIIFEVKDYGVDKGEIVVKDIKQKNIKNYSAIVDKFNNLIGYMDTTRFQYGNSGLISSCVDCDKQNFVSLANNNLLDKVIPTSHFMSFVWGKRNGDPRGNSILRAAYSPWWLKQQALKLWIEWCAKYAQPSYWATPPENATESCDINGTPITAVEALLQEGLKLQNSTFAAFPNGTELHVLEVKSNGDAFDLLIANCNTAIRRAILNQSLATGESAHNSRSAAGVHQDALGIKIVKIKNLLSESWKPLFKFLTVAKFGRDYEHLTPKLDLGEGTGFPPSLGEIAQIMGTGKWVMTENQLSRFEKRYNLPPRKKGDKPQEAQNESATATKLRGHQSDSGTSGASNDNNDTPNSRSKSLPQGNARKVGGAKR